MKVTVNPIQTINVKVNQNNQKIVHGTSTFIGAADVQAEVNKATAVANLALQQANTAVIIAQNAYDTANTKYDKTGGTITGNVIITGNTSIGGEITADIETIDGGIFL